MKGNSAIGSSWAKAREEIFTVEENVASDLRVEIMLELIRARRESGLSQYQLSEKSGVKQSAIARMESGRSFPTLKTLQKLLAPLGKKIAIVTA